MNEEKELTHEERVMTRYKELGSMIRNLEAEQRAIKETEIIPSMQDGIQFSDSDSYLAYQFETRNSFDWESAVSVGDIPLEIIQKYMKPTVIRKLVVKKLKDDEQKAIANQQLQIQAKASDMATAIKDALESGDVAFLERFKDIL